MKTQAEIVAEIALSMNLDSTVIGGDFDSQKFVRIVFSALNKAYSAGFENGFTAASKHQTQVMEAITKALT